MSKLLDEKKIQKRSDKIQVPLMHLCSRYFTQLHTFTTSSHSYTFYFPSVLNVLSIEFTPLLLQNN